MRLEAGAIGGNASHLHTIRTRPRCRSLQLDGQVPNAQGTELAVYPWHTISETPSKPVLRCNDRKTLLKDLWSEGLSFLVDQRDSRDHLANERTFLAWLRTSMALSMTGIFTTQIFVVQSHDSPHTNLSFFALGIPLSSVCQVAALVNVIAGAFRFWRHQAAMTNGKACSGGWEVLLIGGLVTLVSTIQIEGHVRC
jgi:uncharacterized membrane protein YidH (DUF202 family)